MLTLLCIFSFIKLPLPALSSKRIILSPVSREFQLTIFLFTGTPFAPSPTRVNRRLAQVRLRTTRSALLPGARPLPHRKALTSISKHNELSRLSGPPLARWVRCKDSSAVARHPNPTPKLRVTLASLFPNSSLLWMPTTTAAVVIRYARISFSSNLSHHFH
jgi:hypothetical protein